MITSSRSSLPAMMLWMPRRVPVISVSIGVPRIGKKRIRCSGGGSTLMSLMRSSSVLLVFSTLAYQLSPAGGVFVLMVLFLVGVNEKSSGHKKTAGGWKPPAVLGGCSFALRARLSSAGNREPKVGKKVSAEGGHVGGM
ncbi:hypothetical protein D9M69_575190 [compost metagenome]